MTILVVEDDEMCAQLITETLEMEGYEVALAPNGLEALTMLETLKDVELVLLDRMMPRMDGITFIAEAKARKLLGVVPVIMQTAAGTQQQVIEGASTGVYYYLTKPYEYTHLIAVVRSALSDHGKRGRA